MGLSRTTLDDRTPGVEAAGSVPQTPTNREARTRAEANRTGETRPKACHSIRIPVAFDPSDRPQPVPVGRRRMGLAARLPAHPADIRPTGPPLNHVA